MSNTFSSFSSSSYSYSYSSTSSSAGGQTIQASKSAQTSQTDSSGNTTVQTTYQNLGDAPVQETRTFDAQGRELVGNTGAARIEESTNRPRIEDVTDRQTDADRLYEERIEDEYAKREGGA